MTVTAPALHWYQLETGVYIPDYFVQLDTCVRALCAANAVTAPSATVISQLPGGYLSTWMSQTDTAVRALCSALSVTAPVAMLAGQTFGQLEATYPSSLDVAVRALCNAAPGYTGPLDLTATPAVVAYGQRALSASKLGTALYTLKRASDGTAQSFNSNATNGNAPVAAIATFLGSHQQLISVVIDDPGSGYDDGLTPSTFDVTVVGGTFAVAAIVNVTTDGGGLVVTINSITVPGSYTAAPSNPATTTGDDGTNHGTGLALDLVITGGTAAVWTDQSGNFLDAIQNAAGIQPTWAASQFGDVPGLLFTSFTGAFLHSGQLLATADATLLGGAYTIFAVTFAKPQGSAFQQITGINYNQFAGDGEVVVAGIIAAGGNDVTLNADASSDGETLTEAGGRSATVSNVIGAAHLLEFAWTFGETDLLVDGVAQTIASNFDIGPVGTVAGPFAIGTGDVVVNTSRCFNGVIGELFVFASLLSPADRTAIRQNIATYYGVVLP